MMADQIDKTSMAKLACSLGVESPDSLAHSQPYIKYIENQWTGKRTKGDYMGLFADILSYFHGICSPIALNFSEPELTVNITAHPNDSIQSCIEVLTADAANVYFNDTPASSEVRKMAVTDAVVLILGTWALMKSYFVPSQGRQSHILSVTANHNVGCGPLDRSPASLINGSGLLPNPKESTKMEQNDQDVASAVSAAFSLHSSAGLVESLSITSRDLNLVKLVRLARVRVLWTDNVSRHLLLSKRGKRHYLELFALPCALESGTRISLSPALADEIQSSYANLFNPCSTTSFTRVFHVMLGTFVGLRLWCWCITCSSRRLRTKELRRLQDKRSPRGQQERAILEKIPHDPFLAELANREATWWDQTEFENLWPRILALDKCLQEAKPWSFWVLLRDNRDTVQYWTFLYVQLMDSSFCRVADTGG